MKTSKVVVGLIGGLAAGAVLGILFAPDKGSNTRKKIAKKSNGMKENLKDNFNDFLSNVEDKYNNLTSKDNNVVKEVVEDFSDKINREFTSK